MNYVMENKSTKVFLNFLQLFFYFKELLVLSHSPDRSGPCLTAGRKPFGAKAYNVLREQLEKINLMQMEH